MRPIADMDGYGDSPDQTPEFSQVFPDLNGFEMEFPEAPSFMGPPQWADSNPPPNPPSQSTSNFPAPRSGQFRVPARPRRKHEKVEDRSTRQERYERIERLSKELKSVVREEMTSRKELWDVDGGREEEAFWEQRKQVVYKSLEELVEEIQRAFRDRDKEAVMDLWTKEIEERRVNQAWPLHRPES